MSPPPPRPRDWLGLLGELFCGIAGPLLLGWGLHRGLIAHHPDAILLIGGGFAATLPQQWRWACKIADRPRRPRRLPALRISCSHQDCTPARPCVTCRMLLAGWRYPPLPPR